MIKEMVIQSMGIWIHIENYKWTRENRKEFIDWCYNNDWILDHGLAGWSHIVRQDREIIQEEDMLLFKLR